MSDPKEPKPRAALDLSLPLDEPEQALEQPRDLRGVKQVAEASGFTARAPVVRRSVKKHRRPKTGRDYPFNTKIRPETYELLSRLSTELTEEEGRVVSMAEILERALGQFSDRRRSKSRPTA